MEQFIKEWNWRTPMATQKTGSRRSRKRRNSETSSDGAPPIRVLRSYGVDEKLEIIDFAKNNGNRAAGREYNVAESSIREWRKNEDRLRQQVQQSAPQSTQKTITALRDIPKCEVGQVPLSLSISPVRRESPSADNQENEASLGAASSHSNHSGSPTISLSGNDSNQIPIYGSGRRKARQPRKIICVEQES